MHKAPTKDEEPFRAFELKRVEYTAKVEVARKSMYKYRNSAENGVGIFKMYTYIILMHYPIRWLMPLKLYNFRAVSALLLKETQVVEGVGWLFA